jgi:hypothetical protein
VSQGIDGRQQDIRHGSSAIHGRRRAARGGSSVNGAEAHGPRRFTSRASRQRILTRHRSLASKLAVKLPALRSSALDCLRNRTREPSVFLILLSASHPFQPDAHSGIPGGVRFRPASSGVRFRPASGVATTEVAGASGGRLGGLLESGLFEEAGAQWLVERDLDDFLHRQQNVAQEALRSQQNAALEIKRQQHEVAAG